MTTTYEGTLGATGFKFAIVASRFNSTIVDSLVAGAIDAVTRSGGDEDAISIYRAPGAFEIPQVLNKVLAKGGCDAVVCLGAVIRGGTPHFEYIAGAVTRGVSQIAQESSVPVAFGVLTTDTIEQAIERSGPLDVHGSGAGNKGFEAAMAAIEMVNLLRSMD